MYVRRAAILLSTLCFSLLSFAQPRTLPKEQAAHFCQLFVNDGTGSIYPLTTYAQHLTTLLNGSPSYGDFTAEQVFTGLIFFYDDWANEPFLLHPTYENLLLIHDLRSGATLRIFPHQTEEATRWYAPTDSIPGSVGTEHRRYMQEVFSRLNAEVQAGHWKTVDAYVDRMIQYQCQFGGTTSARKPAPSGISLFILAAAFLLLLVLAVIQRKKNKKQRVIP